MTNRLEVGILEAPDPFYSNQSKRRGLCEQEMCWFIHSSSKTTAPTCLSLKPELPSVAFKLEFMGPAPGVSQSVSGGVTTTGGAVVSRFIPVTCISRRESENFCKGCECVRFSKAKWSHCLMPFSEHLRFTCVTAVQVAVAASATVGLCTFLTVTVL